MNLFLPAEFGPSKWKYMKISRYGLDKRVDGWFHIPELKKNLPGSYRKYHIHGWVQNYGISFAKAPPCIESQRHPYLPQWITWAGMIIPQSYPSHTDQTDTKPTWFGFVGLGLMYVRADPFLKMYLTQWAWCPLSRLLIQNVHVNKNEWCQGVLNHRHFDCLFNSLLMLATTNTLPRSALLTLFKRIYRRPVVPLAKHE